MFKATYSKSFVKTYKKFSPSLRRKVDKQIRFLLKDLRHPSIRAKKMQGLEDRWEGRVDRSYRLTFIIRNDIITLLTVGPHDEGLGKN